MSRISPRVRMAVAVGLTCVILIVWPAAWTGPDGETSRAAQWATDYAQSLPSTLASIQAFPVSYQVAIYRALPAKTRLGVWREHLDQVSERGDIPPNGRQAVRRLRDSLAESDFATGAVDRVELRAAVTAAAAELGPNAPLVSAGAWQHMGHLDPRQVGLRDAIRALRVRAIEAIAGTPPALGDVAVVHADDPPDCQCWVAENGQYNCAEKEGFTKFCLPRGAGPYYLCKLKDDQYTGPCSWTQTRPCDGWCAWEPNQAGCGSCDDSPSCCSNCFGTWDPNLMNCDTGSPLLVKLSRRDSYRLTSVEDGVDFDISARGRVSRVAWTPAGSDLGFVVLDRNGNGIIDDGSELFGTETALRNGKRAPNGFVALYDLDGGFGVTDMKIDRSDVAYSQLRIWVDENHNGFSESDELLTLAQAGIISLPFEYRETPRADENGNKYKYVGHAVFAEGGRAVERRMFDVFFAVAR